MSNYVIINGDVMPDNYIITNYYRVSVEFNYPLQWQCERATERERERERVCVFV